MQQEITTNLPIKDNLARAREYQKMEALFGYLPAIGPSMNELRQAQRILADICKRYPIPPNMWVVECRSGMVTVVNDRVDPDFGWRGHEGELDNDGHKVRHIAGGLLEMYGIEGQSDRDYSEAKRGLRGNIVRAV